MADGEEQWVVQSLREVADFWGVSVKTVKDEWRAGGMPGSARRWDLRAIAQWYRQKRGGIAAQDELAKVQLARARAKAEMEHLQVEERRGKLVSREDVERWRLGLIHWVCGIFDRAPSEVMTKISHLVPAKIARKVKRALEDYFRAERTKAADRPGYRT